MIMYVMENIEQTRRSVLVQRMVVMHDGGGLACNIYTEQ
jgi:hypothetical protein